jgi:hypothetical protein
MIYSTKMCFVDSLCFCVFVCLLSGTSPLSKHSKFLYVVYRYYIQDSLFHTSTSFFRMLQVMAALHTYVRSI